MNRFIVKLDDVAGKTVFESAHKSEKAASRMLASAIVNMSKPPRMRGETFQDVPKAWHFYIHDTLRDTKMALVSFRKEYLEPIRLIILDPIAKYTENCHDPLARIGAQYNGGVSNL